MLNLRKKIYEDTTEGKTEYDYCFIHTEQYITVDASYVFNRCSAENYKKNLQVTAMKIAHINKEATRDDVVSALVDVMNMAARGVHYPSVLTGSAGDIVDSVFGKTTIGSVEEFVHGNFYLTEEFKVNKGITKALSRRKTEWKFPEVKKLVELTEEEELKLDSIKHPVDAFNYLSSRSRAKKTSYAQKYRKLSKDSKLDSIVHDSRVELSEEDGVNVITEKMLYECVLESIDVSQRLFIASLNRLRGTGEIGKEKILTHNEALIKESTEKMEAAGYGIHRKNKIINKCRVKDAAKVSKRTVEKRWHEVEPTFTELNNKLKDKTAL